MMDRRFNNFLSGAQTFRAGSGIDPALAGASCFSDKSPTQRKTPDDPTTMASAAPGRDPAAPSVDTGPAHSPDDPQSDNSNRPYRFGPLVLSLGRQTFEEAMWGSGVTAMGAVLAAKATAWSGPLTQPVGIAAGALIALASANVIFKLFRSGEISWQRTDKSEP